MGVLDSPLNPATMPPFGESHILSLKSRVSLARIASEGSRPILLFFLLEGNSWANHGDP
jgi:hypothetical protein